MDDSTDVRSDTGSSLSRWEICGNKFPKAEVVLFTQVTVLYTVIVVSIYNLTTRNGDSNLLDGVIEQLLWIPSAEPVDETRSTYLETVSTSHYRATRRWTCTPTTH